MEIILQSRLKPLLPRSTAEVSLLSVGWGKIIIMLPSETAPLPPGWTAWVTEPSMLHRMKNKPRPYCRGRCVQLGGPWFPGSGHEPIEGLRWAVRCSSEQLPGLTSDGWFLASMYVTRPCDFVPKFTRTCGQLPVSVIDALHAKLQNFFWDQNRFRHRKVTIS